ncbi:hypothetical protein GCM10009654_57630 [Streptomyces hebeiensis]|uniref:Helix-turn-helix domain-containing protein n=1 Tax=Streptomyces hebeiensis TaxID=229486 RepID=A0ABP4FNK1_9ACTN
MPESIFDLSDLPVIPYGKHLSPSETEALLRKVIPLYQAGASIRQIAKKTGRSYGGMHRMLSEAGVKMRGRGGGRRSMHTPTAATSEPADA